MGPIQTQLIEIVEQEMVAHGETQRAFDEGADFLKREGLCEALIEECGSIIVKDLWSYYNRQARSGHRASEGDIEDDVSSPTALASCHATSHPTTASLSNIYPGRWAVNGHYVASGDLTREDATWLEHYYARQVENQDRRRRVFGSIRRRLHGTEQVRDRYTSSQWRALLHRMESDDE